jgi:hypothetical protein
MLRVIGVCLVGLLVAETATAQAAEPPAPIPEEAEPTPPQIDSPPPAAPVLDAPTGNFSNLPGTQLQSAAPQAKAERVGEIESARDGVTEAWELTDGTVETVVHSAPIHFQDDAGNWARIDNSVVPDGQGGFTNAANGWDVRFTPMTPGGGGGVEVTTDTGAMRMAPEDAATTITPVPGTGEDANTVTYREVWPGIDVVYRVTSASVKEELVVRKKPTKHTFPSSSTALTSSTPARARTWPSPARSATTLPSPTPRSSTSTAASSTSTPSPTTRSATPERRSPGSWSRSTLPGRLGSPTRRCQ